MPVQVKCPGCNSELTAPDELVGQLASCPQCKSQFPVSLGGESSTPATSPPPSPPPPPDTPKRRAGVVPAGLKSVKGRDSAKVAAAAVNPAEPPTVLPTPSPDVPTADPSTGPPVQPKRQPKRQRRKAKQAKFITAERTETKIQLGADGQLPELVLREADAKEKTEEVSSSGSSPLLIVALVVSIGFSVLLLLVDMSTSRSESRSKQESRESLEAYYIGEQSETSQLQPYQLLIREALQEHSSGDEKSEKMLYKQVLDILHAEGKNKYAGVTGQVTGSAPSDENLEALINILRRE